MPPTKVDHSNTRCYICGTDETRDHWRRYYDEKGKWNGRYVCNRCSAKKRNRETFLSDRRIGNINPNCSSAKGDLFEELTYRWRGVKNLNIENDNYESPLDHSKDPYLGIIQTKGRLYNIYGYWPFGDFEREYNKNFDYMICYCADKNGVNIERIYIFPKEEIVKRKGTAITKNPSR